MHAFSIHEGALDFDEVAIVFIRFIRSRNIGAMIIVYV